MKRPALFPLVMAVLALVIVFATGVKSPPPSMVPQSHLGYEISDNSKAVAGDHVRGEAGLPDYQYDGTDPVEKLVYDTEIEMNTGNSGRGGFTVVAPRIHGSYAEGDRLKVFVTTYHARYQLSGDTLTEEGAGIIPAAITYRQDDRGQYILEDYEQAQDGAYWAPSIKEYCTMPVSGREIPGLADRIMQHYGDYADLHILLDQNLAKHLRKHGITAG